jgi:serine-protein kinase ATM
MATRISLIRSVREKEEREQIGNLVSPFVQNLVEFEKKCLLSLSEAARGARDLQVALNSIVRAQKLEVHASSMVSQEFANVLWLHKEQKLAVQFLKDLVVSSKSGIDALGLKEKLNNAVLLARLVRSSSSSSHEPPLILGLTGCMDCRGLLGKAD